MRTLLDEPAGVEPAFEIVTFKDPRRGWRWEITSFVDGSVIYRSGDAFEAPGAALKHGQRWARLFFPHLDKQTSEVLDD